MFLTKSKSTELDTSSAVKAGKKAQAASTAAALKAQAASQAAAAKAQAASAAAAQKAAAKAQAAGSVAATKAQAAGSVAAAKAQAASSVAAENARQAASVAADNAASAAKSAADSINTGVRQSVLTARSWAAPKLEDAAEYTTTTVAPKVSDVLRSTAGKVSPADTKSRKMSALTWSLLGAAIAAGVGAVAALVRHRYQAAITADSETAYDGTVIEDPIDGAPADETAPVSELVTDEPAATTDDPAVTETSVNGRVSSNGR